MDIQFFINVLLKRKWLILATMLTAAVAAYLFVNMQDQKFKAAAVVSTGIMGAQGLNTEREIPFFQQFQIEMSINNMMEFIKSRKNINLLSYSLLLNDMDTSRDRPFRQMEIDEEDPINYSEVEIQALLDLMRIKVDSLQPYLDDPLLEPVYKDIAKAYKYDHEMLLEDLVIGMKNADSDLLSIEFDSENAELCAFTVNTFCTVVLKNHRELRIKEDKAKVEFYRALADNKKKELNDKEFVLNTYNRTGSILDLDNQKESTVTQIKELEISLEEYQQRKEAAIKNIADLDVYLSNYSGTGQDDASKILSSKSILQLQDKIKKVNDAYIESGLKDNKLRILKEATEKQLATQLKLHAEARKGKELDNDASGDNILSKKIEAEQELNLSQGAIISLNNELSRMKGKSLSLLTNDAAVKKMEREIDVAKNEYVNLKSELNMANINLQNVTDQLNLIEHAQVPDEPEPANKAIISVFSAVVAGIMATFLIFLLAYFDNSLSTPAQFEKFTHLNVLGKINKVKTKDLDLALLYNSNGQAKSLDYFKESIRNMRYLIENSGSAVFLFTSTKPGEGKTFTLLNLAHSFSLKNKKVLLIDTNFKQNTLSQLSEESNEPNLELQKLIVEHHLADIFGQKKINGLFNIQNLDVIANNGNNLSPAEIFAGKDFLTFQDNLTLHYDLIFLEAPAMNKYTDAKELAAYAEKVIAIFSADSDLTSADEESLEFIQGLENKFLGAVLNKVDLKNLN
ncbi:MAG: succinoglycan biosynthesis transport protein ExoP [Saprospiraceae bacterium]|jgi:succinoglycan biosynthesis transport protein ExoP